VDAVDAVDAVAESTEEKGSSAGQRVHTRAAGFESGVLWTMWPIKDGVQAPGRFCYTWQGRPAMDLVSNVGHRPLSFNENRLKPVPRNDLETTST
jgi:hypothetical protein